LFVLWGAALPYEGLIHPLQTLTLSPDFKAIGLTLLARTPLTRDRLAQFKITDLYQALYQRKDVFLVSDELYNRLLAAYLAEHYGVRLGGKVVFGDAALRGMGFYTFIDLHRLPQTRLAPGGVGNTAGTARHKPTGEEESP
jgi:hypothetical protein